jgi:hypothetical protein
MARRFSNIRQAPRLNTAFTAYRNWEDAQATRTPNIGGGVARGRSVPVQISPFGLDLAADERILIKVTQRARTFMSGGIGTHVQAPTAAARRRAGFTPAKVVLFAGTGTSRVERSGITGLPYLKKGGESYSHGFGAATATEREYEAFNAVATALTDEGTNRTASYQPEKFRQV